MEGCIKEVKAGNVGNTQSCIIVRGKKWSVGGRGDMGGMGDMEGRGDQRSRSSWERRSMSKANKILRRLPGLGQPKVRMFKRIIRYCEVDCCDKLAFFHCNKWQGRP